MPSWHAYASDRHLTPGSEILVTGGSENVRVLTGDQVTIEAPTAQRMRVVVADRDGDAMKLVFPDGRLLTLRMTTDEGFADFHLAEGFSRQSWRIE